MLIKMKKKSGDLRREEVSSLPPVSVTLAVGFFFLLLLFETGPHYVAQADLKLSILLP
jgi:hypothetical protein